MKRSWFQIRYKYRTNSMNDMIGSIEDQETRGYIVGCTRKVLRLD